jgi:hypothetical protein
MNYTPHAFAILLCILLLAVSEASPERDPLIIGIIRDLLR